MIGSVVFLVCRVVCVCFDSLTGLLSVLRVVLEMECGSVLTG